MVIPQLFFVDILPRQNKSVLLFKHLQRSIPVEVVTGAIPSEEREIRVEELGTHENRILVATDCLSEGINLQAHFDAVVHYDLSWNPTRHQQREGRIDRFGQKAPTVRTVLMYGENNPVDGAVLEVIIRKAEAIAKQTGVRVPLPDDEGSLTKALMSKVMLRSRGQAQMSLGLDFTDSEEAREIEMAWVNASEQEKKTRTIFAQNSLKPEEVIAEWEASQSALGGYEDTKRFVSQAMKRLGQPLEELKSGAFKAAIHLAPPHIRERFISESLIEEADQRAIRIGFAARPRRDAYPFIERTLFLPHWQKLSLRRRLINMPIPKSYQRCREWEHGRQMRWRKSRGLLLLASGIGLTHGVSLVPNLRWLRKPLQSHFLHPPSVLCLLGMKHTLY